MKQDLGHSTISVPIPTELYMALLDSLHAGGSRKDPVASIVAIIRKQVSESKTEASLAEVRPDSGGEWSDDWISFQSPPSAPRTVKTISLANRMNTPQEDRLGWCIGCGCPSPDLLD